MRSVLRHAGVFVNLHKDCGEPNRPLETVRLSLLLSAGARVISESSDPADEELYAGIVSFAPAPQLGRVISDALAEEGQLSLTAVRRAAARREEAFRARFAPAPEVRNFRRAWASNRKFRQLP